MIELPELSILLILEHLSYEDLQSLRVTCKKLKAIVDRRIPRSLHLFVNGYPEERELLHTGELVRYANTFQAPELTILRSTKFKSLFTGLLKLTIFKHYNGSDENVDLNDLNCFQGLVHLQLENVAIESGRLSLRNLKIASIEIENRTTNFVLDCPQLKVLDLRYRSHPSLTQETANSVQHLYLEDEENRETYLFVLYAKLRSLSTICFDNQYGSESLNRFVVALVECRVSMPSLKQIQSKELGRFPERGVVLKNLIELKNGQETKYIEVLINGKVMKRDELTEMQDLLHKIFPDNPEDPRNHINQLLCLRDLESGLLRHFSENPILHCLLPSAYELVLRSDEDVAISKQLIGRLMNLTSLEIAIAVDDQFFECIRESCRRIRSLRIPSAHLKQQQLDQIPNYLQNLSLLSFGSEFGQRNFNLNFFTKFTNLSGVNFHYNIPKEMMGFLFENCKHPHFYLGLHGMQRISILRWRNGQFRFIIRPPDTTSGPYESPKTTEFDSLEEAIEHYYRNDLFNCPWNGTRRTAFRFPCSLI